MTVSTAGQRLRALQRRLDAQNKSGKYEMAAQRRREIERFAQAIDVADTDDFRRFLVVWAWHNPNSKDPLGALMFASARMGRQIRLPEALEAFQEALTTRKVRKADALGKYLGLTDALRTELKIRTIGACDVPKRQRAKRRKERQRGRDWVRRRKQGKKTRAEYLAAHSVSRDKPWQRENPPISKRTWYRRRAKSAA